MRDLISRQAAIDALKNDMASLDHIIQGMSGYDVRLDAYVSQRNQVNCDIDTISNLPPAQPEPCGDAVSRKAVKDGFVEMCSLICPYTEKQRHTMCGSCLLGTAFDVLEATQPVTPKQRTDLLKAEIKRMKRSFTICINRDYYTGYMSALSAVEGYIAQLEGANNDT